MRAALRRFSVVKQSARADYDAPPHEERRREREEEKRGEGEGHGRHTMKHDAWATRHVVKHDMVGEAWRAHTTIVDDGTARKQWVRSIQWPFSTVLIIPHIAQYVNRKKENNYFEFRY